MYAVFEQGGKQFKAQKGDVLFLEKMDAEVGAEVKFDKVLAIGEGENVKFGTPVVSGASVVANVIKNGKARKINILKYKPKKHYCRHQGHRQPYTKVEIIDIVG